MKLRILILILLFAGCNSKYPLYHDSDLIEVPQIEGTWGSDEKETISFVKHKPNEYWYYSSEDSTEYFIVKFLRLNGILFMDMQYGGLNDTNYTKLTSKFDSHIIAKVYVTGSTLRMVAMNSDYLIKLAQDKTIKMEYELTQPSSDPKLSNSYIISEKTDKLQELVKKYCNDPNVFPDKDMTTLKKIK